jgi:hypothetical protein
MYDVELVDVLYSTYDLLEDGTSLVLRDSKLKLHYLNK